MPWKRARHVPSRACARYIATSATSARPATPRRHIFPRVKNLRHHSLPFPRHRNLSLRERRGRSRPRAGSCGLGAASLSCAASSVLASSVAIVIGPTPPGTGVIQPARSVAAANSTSPHQPARGVAIHADVDHDRAGPDPVAQHHLRLADRGHQHLGLAGDLRGQVARARVADGVVQPASSSSSAIGRPTMLDAPTTTACLPTGSTPMCCSIFMTP